jgi:hypothetical protein
VPEIDPAMLDAADPPTVPRFSNHSRKRSNTAPRIPIPTIRSFSSQGTMPSVASTRASSDTHGAALPPSVPGPGQSHMAGGGAGPGTMTSGRSSGSRRTSETSVRTGNFFEAIGTVRMEAFIDQTESNRHRVAAGGRRHIRKPSSPWSLRQAGLHEVDLLYEEEMPDPFRGF